MSYWCSSAICFCRSAVYWGPAGLIPINCGWPKNCIPDVCIPIAIPACWTPKEENISLALLLSHSFHLILNAPTKRNQNYIYVLKSQFTSLQWLSVNVLMFKTVCDWNNLEAKQVKRRPPLEWNQLNQYSSVSVLCMHQWEPTLASLLR